MPAHEKYTKIFTPLKVGPLTLKNRIQFSPMVTNMTSVDGEVSSDYVDFVERQAKTGVALITLGATPVCRESGIDYLGEVDVTDDSMVPGLRRMAEAAHVYDAKISCELFHSGRGADPALLEWPYAIAPSDIPLPDRAQIIKEMDADDMAYIIDCFCDCAKRLQFADFDMIMIHAAHGNLIAPFLSPMSNHRTDEYGGSSENRFRFPLELLKAVREAVGKGFPIEMRISGDEIVEGGMRIEEVIEFIKLAQEYIDLVHVSAGLIVDQRAQFNTMPPYFKEKGCNVPYARAVKRCPDIHIPVATVGGISDLDIAEGILSDGDADLIAMARALLCDGEMIKKYYVGTPEAVRPCLRCFECANNPGSYIRCATNPALGRQGKYADVPRALQPKKIVVIGGGAAGMTATRTLAERGHDVVLFEQSETLGGLLKDISLLPFKTDLARHLAWAQASTHGSGADIRLGVKADPELVLAEMPDAVIIATGSEAIKPPIPGIEGSNVVEVLEVEAGRADVGQKVVMCGAGVSGCESALMLAMEGKDVTLLDIVGLDRFAPGLPDTTRGMLMMLMEEHGVKCVPNTRVDEITISGVKATGPDGPCVFEADTVVAAFGMKSKAEVRDSFADLISEAYAVGDARKAGNIKTAYHTAYNIAVNC
jgi:2,4-dienoyl-CoA reductase-like NADH-dependent reductase (Old Yellow Enzyme family)/thioredoxin reductase